MDHYAENVTFGSPTGVARWGIADGRLHGKDRLREHFTRGLEAPGLHFELLDVLLGVDGYTIVYRRETGAVVADVVTVDEHGRGLEVRAYSGQTNSRRTNL